jgi:hypothetical protein
MTMGLLPALALQSNTALPVFGAISYTVFSAVQRAHFCACSALRKLHASEHRLFAPGFTRFTMVIFGSMYYIVPRCWARMALRIPDQTAFLGVGLRHWADDAYLLAGGFLRENMENPSPAFSETTETVLPYSRAKPVRLLGYRFAFIFAFIGRTDALRLA